MSQGRLAFMRRFTISLLVCLTLALTCARPRANSLQLRDEAPSSEEWKWLDKNFWKILDSYLPLEKKPGVVISYRSFESLLQLDSPELSFSISRPLGTQNASLTAHLRVPDGHSIVRQLLEAHRTSPKGSINEIKARLRFTDWNIPDDQCPQLRDLLQSLPEVKLGFRTDRVILDPTVQEFYLNSDDGSVTAKIIDNENPLSKWGVNASATIQTCANRISPNAPRP